MIYIVTHKECYLPNISGYVPILVGAEGKGSEEILRDDSGDNISSKNQDYCELTGIYWIWKNTDDDYKGIVHYRRFFGKSRWSCAENDIYSIEDLNDFLNDYDIIITYSEHVRFSLKEKLIRYHCSERVYYVFRDSVQELYPEYISNFDDVMKGNVMCICNMMYCKRDLFDSYCGWLFNILNKAEEKLKKENIDFKSRLYGFISERLLNVWLVQNNIKCKQLPIINTEMSLFKRTKWILTTYVSEIIFRVKMIIKK